MERSVLRSLLLIGCLGTVLPAHAQDLSRKVSLSMPGVRMSQILKELSRQGGVPLTAAPKTADDVLLIKVKDVTLKELLERIATVTNGAWKESGGGYELTRPSALEDQVTKEERAVRATELDKALGAADARMAKLPAFDQAEAGRMAEQQAQREKDLEKRVAEGGSTVRVGGNVVGDMEESPAARAILALLKMIGTSSLASLPPNDRVVFALPANQAQQTLSGRSNDIVKQFVKQQQMLTSANQAKQAQRPEDGRRIVMAGPNGGDMGPGDPGLGLGKAIVVVQRIGDNLRVQLVVADPKGQTIATGFYMLAVRGVVAPASETKGKPIALSPVAAEFAALTRLGRAGMGAPASVIGKRAVTMIANGTQVSFSSGDLGEKPVAMSAELRKRLLNPEEFDPQGLAPAEGFYAAADARQENLVACLPDSSVMALTRGLGEGSDVDRFLGRLAPNAGVKVTEEAGWLVAMPSKPASARATRVSRSGLGKMVRALDRQSVARLGDLTDFAMVQAKPVDSYDFDGWAMRLISAGGGSEAVSLLSQPDILRFYGSLSSGQRAALEAGGTLSLNNLTPMQKGYLAREVYQSQAGPARRGQQNSISILSMMRDGLSGERTELMPGGIPESGLFRMKVERQPAALGTDESGSSAVLTPDALASRIFQAERGDMAFFGPVSKIQKFAPAGQVKLTLLFEFSEYAQMQRSLSDTWIEKSQVVAYEGLPDEMRMRTEAALTQIRNSLGGVQIKPPVKRGGNTPPPQ